MDIQQYRQKQHNQRDIRSKLVKLASTYRQGEIHSPCRFYLTRAKKFAIIDT